MSLVTPIPLKNVDRSVPKLLVIGCCAILFTLGVDFVLHRNIDRVTQARDWVEHSKDVQTNLQGILLRLDRLDSVAHLYLLNKLPNTLRETQDLSVTLESDTDQVTSLVADNHEQLEAAIRLRTLTRELGMSLHQLDALDAVFPASIQLGCQQAVIQMQEQERALLLVRERESRNGTQDLIVSSLLLAGFSILVVVVLFGVLVRDALFRHTADERVSESTDQLATNIQVLEDRATELKLLGDARDELQMCVSVKEAYDIAVHFVAQLLPTSSGALCMIDHSRATIGLQASWGATTNIMDCFSLDGCCAMRSGQIRRRTPEISVLHCAHFSGPPPERYVCVPLIAHGDTLGVLYVEYASDEATLNLEHFLGHLRALLQLASMTVAGLNLRSKLENQSIRDGLTGLFNRHFMEITLEREVRRAARRDTSMAVFMIDADHFKHFNDTYGHAAGDSVLRTIADRFLTSVRGEDIVCRYGGEEFIVILPDIGKEKAAERAEQIRETIQNIRMSEHGIVVGAVTVSIGVAMYPQDGRAVDELLQASDRSVYAAKSRGRNQVVFAAEAGSFPIPAKEIQVT